MLSANLAEPTYRTVFWVWTLFFYAVPGRRSVMWMIGASVLFLLSFVPYMREGTVALPGTFSRITRAEKLGYLEQTSRGTAHSR
jgi:hypothetical protein